MVYEAALEDILGRSIDAFVNDDEKLARTVEPLEEVIDLLNKNVKKHHMKRLKKGKCTIELGLVLSDMATNFERVADHCSNIAVYIIQMKDNQVEAHDYVNSIRDESNEEFDMLYQNFKEKYELKKEQ